MNITVNGAQCTEIKEIRKVASKEFSDFVEEFYNEKKYIIAHTSGSTGEPKEIHLLKEDMIESAKLTNDFFKLTTDSLFYLCLSPHYIAGKMMIVRCLILNAKICEVTPSNAPLDTYDGSEMIDLIALVPSQIIYLLNNPDKRALIKDMIIGGGAVSEKLNKRMSELSLSAFATYGMTETCSHVALAAVTLPVSPFKALGNVTFSLDERGCLVIHTPQFHNKTIVTNDIVELISNTDFFWKGRYDNVINTGGIKVFPEEIEKKLVPLLSHSKYYITSIPSDKWGNDVALAVEYPNLKEDKKIGEINPALIEKMKSILSEYEIPKHYIALKNIPLTSSGKIIREKR